jgi:hypothetical protein
MQLDWSHVKLPPFKHQREDVATMIDRQWFFIASEMRTGKTKIAIDAAQFLFHAGLLDRMIVISPEPVRGVWVGATADALGGELHEHLWDNTPFMVTEFHSRINQWRGGPGAAVRDMTSRELRIIVTNYEFIRPFQRRNSPKKNDDALQKLLKYCTPRTLLVLDESSAITNHKSEQFDACFQMRQKCGRVALMDGAPMDTPLQLFAIGRMLHDSILECKYITHYKNRYAVQEPVTTARGKEIVKNGRTVMKITDWKNLDDLQARFAPYTVRRLQKDCQDMPLKLPAVTLKAELTTKTWKYYTTMRDEMVVDMMNGTASISKQSIVKFMRLSQITGGFLGGFENTGLDDVVCDSCAGTGCNDCEGSGIGAAQPAVNVHEIGREKLDVLLWLIASKLEQDKNLKMVIWARFMPETLRIISEAQRKFPQMIVAGLHGGCTKTQKSATKALLHPSSAPAGPVLVVGTLGTGSFGLDFSAAHTSVNYSYDHSLRKFLQSGERVSGPRQTHPIEYYDIVAVGPKGQKTYDAVIVQARRDKHELATWTTDAWVKALSDVVV